MANENETHEEFDLPHLSGYLSLIDDGERIRAVVRSHESGSSRHWRLNYLRYALQMAEFFVNDLIEREMQSKP